MALPAWWIAYIKQTCKVKNGFRFYRFMRSGMWRDGREKDSTGENRWPVLALSGPSPAALNRKRTLKRIKSMNAAEVALSRAGDFFLTLSRIFCNHSSVRASTAKNEETFYVLCFSCSTIYHNEKRMEKIQTTRMFKGSWWFFSFLWWISLLHSRRAVWAPSKGCGGWRRNKNKIPSQWRTEK